MNQLPQGQDLYALIDELYGTKLGRDPDADGRQWWYDNAGQYLQQGGQSRLEDAFTNAASAYPVDQQYARMRPMVPGSTDLTRQEAVDWDNYMNAAAAEQRGMASMPFVAPSTASLAGMHPDHIWQTYYRSPEEQAAVQKAMQGMYQPVAAPSATPSPAPAVSTQEDPTKKPAAGFGALGVYRDR